MSQNKETPEPYTIKTYTCFETPKRKYMIQNNRWYSKFLCEFLYMLYVLTRRDIVDYLDFLHVTESNEGTFRYYDKYTGGVHLHRKYGPAIEFDSGDKSWYKFGMRHRDANKPAIEYANGNLSFYKFGMRHSEDGPAVIKHDGKYKAWYFYGELHNFHGPAVINIKDPDNPKYIYALDGRKKTLDEFTRATGYVPTPEEQEYQEKQVYENLDNDYN